MSGRLVFRIINGVVFAPLFLLSVLVQYNDPDPVFWMLIYGWAAALCVLAVTGRLPWRGAATLALVAGAWMATLLPGALAFMRSTHEPIAFYMKTGDALEEQAREAGGLLLVCAWSTVLAVVGWRAQRRAQKGASA